MVKVKSTLISVSCIVTKWRGREGSGSDLTSQTLMLEYQPSSISKTQDDIKTTLFFCLQIVLIQKVKVEQK